MIIAGAIISAAGLWSGNFMRMRKSNLQNDVATLLERKMAEVEAKYTGKPLGEIPDSDGGEFEDNFPQYRWEMKSREMKFPDLSAVIIGQQDMDNKEMLISMIKQMTEFINKVVKEVKVTIIVKRGGKELKFAASQYFIDYNQSFAGGGVPGGIGSGSSGGSDGSDTGGENSDAGAGGGNTN